MAGGRAPGDLRRSVMVEQRIRCRSAPPRLWEVITDTDRLNRAAGLGRLTLAPHAGPSAARYRVATRVGAFQVEYDERPFEWVYPRSFRVLRRFRTGPAAAVETSFELEPVGRGTALTLRVAIAPALPLIGPVLQMQARRVVGRLVEEIEKMDTALAAGKPQPGPAPKLAGEGPSLNVAALERATAALRRATPALADRLAALLREGDEVSVSRIRPFELADAWGLPRRELLAACLHAVRAGLLELRWEVICPSCRTAASTVPTLAELGEHGRCHLCDVAIALDLDEAVEATFAPAPAVRAVDAGPYCIGGPARTPHVLAQVILPSQGVGLLDVPTSDPEAARGSPRRYRVFVRGGASAPVEVAAGAPAEISLDAAAPGAGVPLAVAPGGAITLTNRTPDELHAKLERLTFREQAATARILTSMAEFRRDFSRDVLRPGAALKVSRVTLFFSDLTDSTLLYARAGDAAAFRLVQDHFDVVMPILERGSGAIVKTIGDAVMAAFCDEQDGLEASLSVLSAFERFREQRGDARGTHIKLGLHTGPCYVITANGALDYFGQTVNIAARLQAQARSGELVIDAGLADRAIAAGALPEAWVRERWTPSLKGVEQPLEAVRVRRS